MSLKGPEMKIGFSTFAQLRPRQCIVAGAAGTHLVCVCMLHQNIKLMMTGGESLTDGELKHYQHFTAAIQCNPPNIECYSGNCGQCPGTEPLRVSLQAAFNMLLTQWSSSSG